MVYFRNHPLNTQCKRPQYPPNTRMDGPQSMSAFWKREKFLGMLKTAHYTYVKVLWEMFPQHWCWGPGLQTPRWRQYVPLKHNESISLLSVITQKTSVLYLYILLYLWLQVVFLVHKFLSKKQGVGNTILYDLKVQSIYISDLLAVAPTDTDLFIDASTNECVWRVAANLTHTTWACQHQTGITLSEFSFCWSAVMVFI